MQRTLILLKPDTVVRGRIGTILTRFEEKGYEISAMRMVHISPEMAKKHYSDHVSKPFYPELEAYITSGRVVALILSGPEVIRVVRQMVGATNGLDALPGTIRGDFATSSRQNLVHASDSEAAAEKEIAIFFPEFLS